VKTEDLIGRLAEESAATPLDDRRMMALAALAVIVPLAIFFAVLGVRPGLVEALINPGVVPKTILPALAFALALPELPRLARPDGAAETRLFRLALPALAVLLLFGITLLDPEAVESCLEPGLFGVVECLGLISLLSIVPVLVALRLLKRGAVTRPGLAGAVAGFVSGSGVAAGYSLFCTRDNPLFYLVWYGIAIGLATLAGRALGRRWLVW
jgi:hypothetical protein